MTGMPPLPEEGLDLRQELRARKYQLIDEALSRTLGNRAQAAKLLGLKPETFIRMLQAIPRSACRWGSRSSSVPTRVRFSTYPDPETPVPTPASEAPTLRDLPKHKAPSDLRNCGPKKDPSEGTDEKEPQ